MADIATLQRFSELYGAGYLPSVGAWVQVAPGLGLTTFINVFNTLAKQEIEYFLFNTDGNTVYQDAHTLPTGQTLRIDLESVVPAAALPFEGSMWVWCKGDTDEGSIGLQAIDLEFVDRNMPEGHVMGGVHLIFDFLNTNGTPPYLDLVSPRLLVGETPEGGAQYQNFVGLSHVVLGISSLTGPELVLTISDESGRVISASETITLPPLGSWFGDLQAIFPNIQTDLMRSGQKRGYGTLNVRAVDDAVVGLAGMVKIVEVESGAMLVDHLNDRNFARPAMKDT